MHIQQFVSNTLNGRVWQGEEAVVIKLDAAQLKFMRLEFSNFPQSGGIPWMSQPGTVSISAHQLLHELRLSWVCASDPILPPHGSHQMHPKHNKPQLKRGTSPSAHPTPTHPKSCCGKCPQGWCHTCPAALQGVWSLVAHTHNSEVMTGTLGRAQAQDKASSVLKDLTNLPSKAGGQA